MPKATIGFETVRDLALSLPGVEEGTMYGSPAVKLRGSLIACIAINKSAEPGSLAVRIPFSQRDELLTADPRTYYVTDHYIDYPVVLVRLSRVHQDALRDLLLASWQFVNTKGKRRAPTSKRAKGGRRRG